MQVHERRSCPVQSTQLTTHRTTYIPASPAPAFEATIHCFNYGRRNTSHHGGCCRLPQARGWSRRQADPPHLSGPLEAVHGWRTVQRAGHSWVCSLQLRTRDGASNTSSASLTKLAQKAQTGSSCPYTRRRTSPARSSKRPRPMSSNLPRSENRSARVGRRIGSRCSSLCPRTCSRKNTSSSSGMRTTRA
jgi:hypothetical protein